MTKSQPTPDSLSELKETELSPDVSKRTKMTRDQRRVIVNEIAEMLTYPGSEQKIRNKMRREHGWGATRTNRVINAIFSSWQREDETTRKHQKAQAVRRIVKHIEQARARNSFNAIAAFEAQLSKIQGTEQPNVVRHEHDIGETFAGVLAGMDVTQMKALVAEYDQTVQLAQRALPEVIPDAEVVESLSGDDEFKTNE